MIEHELKNCLKERNIKSKIDKYIYYIKKDFENASKKVSGIRAINKWFIII